MHGDTIENPIVPCSVFTDPQLGRVGMTEKEARQQGNKPEWTYAAPIKSEPETRLMPSPDSTIWT